MNKPVTTNKNTTTDNLCVAMAEWLSSNNLILSFESNYFSSLMVVDKSSELGQKATKKATDRADNYQAYLIKNFIENDKYYRPQNEDYIKFTEYLLKTNNYKLAFSLVSRIKLGKYEASYFNKTMINLFAKYRQDNYVSFVSRYGFLNSNYDLWELVLNNTRSVTDKESIYRIMLTTNHIKNLDSQLAIYNLGVSHFNDMTRFKSFFNKISFNQTSELVNFDYPQQILECSVEIEKLGSLNINKDYTNTSLIHSLIQFLENLGIEHNQILGITKIEVVAKDKTDLNIKITGFQLDKTFWSKFLNNIFKIYDHSNTYPALLKNLNLDNLLSQTQRDLINTDAKESNPNPTPKPDSDEYVSQSRLSTAAIKTNKLKI